MFRIAALAAVAGAVLLGSTQTASTENISAEEGCPPQPLANARAILKESWDREGWRQRNPVKKSQDRELRRAAPLPR